MGSAVLEIYFQSGMPIGSTTKPMKQDGNTTSPIDVNFRIGLPVTTFQKQLVLIQDVPYSVEIKFKTGVPANTTQRPIGKIFTVPEGMTVYFQTGVPKDTAKKEIWKFVNWTIGGSFSEKYYIIRTISKPFLSVDSLPILPRLRGQAYPDKKRPDYHTVLKESASGAEHTYETWQYPRWYIELTYDFLDGNADGSDFRRLLDFIAARKGSLEDFWYRDPDDNATTNQLIAVGDGNTKSFQLCRTYCGINEPVFAVDANYNLLVTIGGKVQTAEQFTINNKGLLIFKTPPPQRAEIRASFHFLYRCRFTEDSNEFENFAHKLWTLKSLSMVTTL